MEDDYITNKYETLPISHLVSEWDALTLEDKVFMISKMSMAKTIDLLLSFNGYNKKLAIDNYHLIPTIISSMHIDDAVSFFRDLDDLEYQEKVLKLIEEQRREAILSILANNEDAVGGIMNPKYLAIRKHWNIEKTIGFIRRAIRHVGTTDYIYVIDDKRTLIGVISFKEILMAHDNTIIKNIMTKDMIFVHDDDKKEKILSILKEYSLSSVPVVSKEGGQLIGIVTAEDALDLLEDQQTENIYKSQGIVKTSKSYIDLSSKDLYLKRLPWLVGMLAAGAFTTNVIHSFEDLYVKMPFLVLFTQVITQTAGNTGAQSATLAIRGLALNEIRRRDIFKVLLKEFGVSFILGLTLGIFMFLRCMYVSPTIPPLEAGIVAAAIFSVTVISALIGAVIPIFISMIKLDPAVIANPLMSTIMDLLSILTYFQIAQFVLSRF